MAFDRPIEADKISGDELDLLSSIVRAPFLGTLMWFLGGSTAINEEKESGCDIDLVISDVSEDDSSCSDDETFMRISNNPSKRANSSKEISPHRIFPNYATKRERRQSWSDESGQSLVECFYESQSPLHKPSKASLSPKILKSVMKHSINGASTASNSDDNNGNIPKFPLNNGLVMPGSSKCDVNSSMKSSGHTSPQWGWYISTTPPQVEMYASGNGMRGQTAGGPKTDTKNPALQQRYESNYAIPSRSSFPHSPHMPMRSHHRHQQIGYPYPGYDNSNSTKIVFTKNVKGVGHRPNMGWPSVPL
mmetsp:Transcript_41553/g.48457  ORF Transcript_41553/g.48457 Transcript_41553/m.48457 type:complete len:305 (+) Transcript_41553:134-1048(+)|eukprot:CAMPEP_0194354524 /NCGR_PEP_ID=MMETSP0174-20130528/2668_1 /TAXON_ID=216777 /ORGANISM="Proboscia alata, Strain PI-D3" /LENGTH=304 /DNA_ID=CAMNT_0039123511 /DNA_START=91 /DNA_END=1005 /DNA_ORIENTATION=+